MAHHEGQSGSEGKIDALHNKIREWIREESASDPDVTRINLDDLTMADIAIARQIDNRALTGGGWDQYGKDLTDELKNAPEDIQKSRGFFHRVAGNKANEILMEKQLEEMKKRSRS